MEGACTERARWPDPGARNDEQAGIEGGADRGAPRKECAAPLGGSKAAPRWGQGDACEGLPGARWQPAMIGKCLVIHLFACTFRLIHV